MLLSRVGPWLWDDEQVAMWALSPSVIAAEADGAHSMGARHTHTHTRTCIHNNARTHTQPEHYVQQTVSLSQRLKQMSELAALCLQDGFILFPSNKSKNCQKHQQCFVRNSFLFTFSFFFNYLAIQQCTRLNLSSLSPPDSKIFFTVNCFELLQQETDQFSHDLEL